MGHNKSAAQKEAQRKADLKEFFIQRLAEYLVKDQAEMSIRLQMGRPEAHAWSRLRSATPLFGYPTVQEAEDVLRKFLS